jgi:gamma-glutamyltranspeptidase/glutathione hydrolase
VSQVLGVVASGHKETSKAARILLEEGGNAFDAALGALCAACVCEPMLASLGGGGFLLAQPAGNDTQVFDFFTQTPSANTGELDFYPIQADFGTATQEFHIGMGSIAVPGVVAGLFATHAALCRLPLQKIIEPAVWLARKGVRINRLQKYVNDILEPIINASDAARALAAPMFATGRLAEVGEYIFNPDLADTFEKLARSGERWFYEGEPARQLVRDCEQHGGLVTGADMRFYRVIKRRPVEVEVYGSKISFNSPPSPGGCLTAFALSLYETLQAGHSEWGSPQHAMALAGVMQAASLVRQEQGLASGMDEEAATAMLTAEHLASWRETLRSGGLATRGTTQISVVDADGSLASMTLSNGEGSAYVLPGMGIMFNNMLGEEDLNPGGFHKLPPGERLASMMTPAIVSHGDGSRIALGSGGSNRIRSAILQVLVNMFEYGMGLEDAVAAPRLHLENNHLSIEKGFSDTAMAKLEAEWPGLKQWPEHNLFFGGVHAVRRFADGEFSAAGDPRRGGAVAFAASQDNSLHTPVIAG